MRGRAADGAPPPGSVRPRGSAPPGLPGPRWACVPSRGDPGRYSLSVSCGTLWLQAQASPSPMEEAPGAAAEGSGVEFGSAERDIIRVPSHSAMEVTSFETFTGQRVPLRSLQGDVFVDAVSIGRSKTEEQLLKSCPAYKKKRATRL